MTAPVAPGEVAPPKHHDYRPLLVLFGLAFPAYVGLFLLGSEAAHFALAGLEALPFVVLALLAYAGAERRWARVLTILWLIGLTGGFAFTALAFCAGLLPGEPASAARLELVAVGLGAALAIGWLCYLPPVRRQLADLIPIDPRSFVHATALVTVVSLTLMSVIPLIALGAPPLLLSIEQQGAGALLGDRSATGQLLDTLYGLIWLVPGTLFAVGFPIARNLNEALVRLGLVRPPARQLGVGVAAGLALAAVYLLLLGNAVDWLWRALGWPTTDSRAFEHLMAFAISPVGAIVVAVSAGLGEELAVRGVLQPRLGLWLSNLFFAALHAFQYNLDGLLVVFLVGLALGLLRRATNTTTSALVHALYNFSLIMVSVLQGAASPP